MKQLIALSMSLPLTNILCVSEGFVLVWSNSSKPPVSFVTPYSLEALFGNSKHKRRTSIIETMKGTLVFYLQHQ